MSKLRLCIGRLRPSPLCEDQPSRPDLHSSNSWNHLLFTPSPSVCSTSVMWRNGGNQQRMGTGSTAMKGHAALFAELDRSTTLATAETISKTCLYAAGSLLSGLRHR